MAPETTMTITLGELARGMARLEDSQKSILEKLDTGVVTRREFEAFKEEVTARRVPWTAVTALVVSALATLGSLGVL
ncbi:hypothetical protein [Sanguibacter massiliensis]|uniref:hypothetical protein n=1 Tax=Sanguibacter massiliensis TaxID=1973217 RepID=UPI000C817B4F|nr:hypothetical protein [Sanguibacter massiliensis]